MALLLLRLLAHRLATGHRRVRVEEMIWSGARSTIGLCDDCARQFWPPGVEGPYGHWRNDPIDRRKR